MRDGAPGAPIMIKGPETGTDRAGRYQAVLYGTGRIFNIDHSWITLDGFTIDGQEQLASVPFPTDLRAIDAWKQSVQDRVEDGRLVYIGSSRAVPRHHRHHDQQHVPQRRGRRVRAAAQQRPRQHDHQLGDPVLRVVRQGRRRRPGRVPQRRGRLHRHQPQVGRPADVRQRHQLAQRRHPQHHPHVRVGVLQHQGERARQRVRGQRVQRQRRVRGVRGQQRRAARLRQHRAQQPDLGQRRLHHQDPERRRGVRPGRQRRREQPALRRGGRDLQDQVEGDAGPVLRQQRRRVRSPVRRRPEGATPAGVTSPC